MEDKRLHRMQIIVRVLDLVACRILVLETMDELNWTFRCEEDPLLFCFQFETSGFDAARTQSKMLYWAWCLRTGEIEPRCSPAEFLKHRPSLVN